MNKKGKDAVGRGSVVKTQSEGVIRWTKRRKRVVSGKAGGEEGSSV